jgi:predicted transcriptional regulator
MEKSVFSKDYRVFLRQLRLAREGSGLTQEQLARRLGKTQSFISKCELGDLSPNHPAGFSILHELYVGYNRVTCEHEMLTRSNQSIRAATLSTILHG